MGKTGIAALLMSSALVSIATSAEAQIRSFAVPAGNLGVALRIFGRQSGRPIIYQSDRIQNAQTAGYRGSASPETALAAILDHTGFAARADRSGAFAIVPAESPASVSVGAIDAGTPGQGDIVVTAQKRSESILKVPVSITALSAAAIERRGLVSASDYLRTVPSVNYVNQGPGQTTLVIRGVYGEPFNTGPTVGIYFGDVPLAGLSIGGSTDIQLVDIARVEVLRGPQGTLYGSNSLSGTVKYVPAAPKLDAFSASVSAGYSNTANYGGSNSDVEAVVNVPIVKDHLALRVVGYHYSYDGFIRNVIGDDPAAVASAAYFGQQNVVANKRHIGGLSYDGVRASLLWRPVDDLQANLIYMHQYNGAQDRPFSQRDLGHYERSVPNFDPSLGRGDAMKITLDLANLAVEYRRPFGTFYSSTAMAWQPYQRLWEIGIFFPSNGYVPSVPQNSITHAKLFTQEARFASGWSGPFQMVAGVFYEKSRQPTDQPGYYFGIPERNPFGVNATGLLYSSRLNRKVSQIAGFGEAAYAVTDRLKFTFGARAFHYKSDFFTETYQTVNPNIIPYSFSSAKGAESGHTFKGSAEYKFSTDGLLYAKFSQGFRLGRPQDLTATRNLCHVGSDGVIDGVDTLNAGLISSDRLDSYEAGAKTRLFGGKASLSFDVYHNNWTNIPISFTPPSCTIQTITLNGGKARANGVEVEGNATVFERLALDFSAGYVDSRLASTTTLGQKGDEVQFTPKWNGHFGAEYRFEILGARAYARADYQYFGTYFDGNGKTGEKFPGYSTLDLAVGGEVKRYNARLYATNITDKYAITSGGFFPAGIVYPIRPRTVGVRLGVTL